MAHYVAPVAFGSTWTIMMIVAFRTQRLGPAVICLLPVPCSVSFASILPLVRLLLVLIVLGSVSSLIPSNSRIPTLPGHVANLLAIPVLYSTLPIVVTFPLSLCSSNSVMPALANGDRGVWCQIDIRTARNLVSKDKMIWCGEVQQKGRPELGAPPPPRPPHPSQHHHHRCHHQMTRYHNCLIRRQDGQQDPPQGPPYPLPDRS
ncbi:hypothetical protein Tco_0191543 [Tanacetum coccineum]